MPNTDSTNYCLACGNALPSSNAACARCDAMSAAGTPLEAPAAPGAAITHTANENAMRGRFARKRASADSAYPSVEEPEPYDPRGSAIVETASGQKLRRAGIGAALVALLAGGLYLAFVPISGHGDSELSADKVARNDIPRLAPDSFANTSFGPKMVSLDRAGTIEAARLAMLRGELRDARARLAMLPANESKRGDVRQITNELIQRELARDAAMGLARACEKAGDTPCVLRAAGDALASDVSDSEARDMLLHAVAQTGSPSSPAGAAPAIIAPAAGVSVTASRRVDTAARLAARRRAAERLVFHRETQSFANNNSDIYARP